MYFIFNIYIFSKIARFYEMWNHMEEPDVP